MTQKHPYNIFTYGFNEYLNNPQNRIVKGHKDFDEGINDALKSSRLFEIDPDIKKLLLLTKPFKSKLMLPFNSIFLNVRFSKEEVGGKYDIIGLLVSYGNLLKGGVKFNENSIKISTLSMGDNEAWFNTFNPSVKENSYQSFNNENQSTFKFTKKMETLLRDFVHNFITFVNSPDVEIVQVIRGEKNRLRRLRQRKEYLPSSSRILIKGRIKEYLNQLKSSGEIGYSYRFWVRGHWRTLKAKRYRTKVGSKLWIFPYIKGKGVLIEKKYKLKAENENN